MSQESTFAGDDDDVEGHAKIRSLADAESAEGDDVEGHAHRRGADAESAESDDVEGHIYVQTPAGPKA